MIILLIRFFFVARYLYRISTVLPDRTILTLIFLLMLRAIRRIPIRIMLDFLMTITVVLLILSLNTVSHAVRLFLRCALHIGFLTLILSESYGWRVQWDPFIIVMLIQVLQWTNDSIGSRLSLFFNHILLQGFLSLLFVRRI